MLSVSHLSKRFGPVCALDDVSLAVPTGGIVGFLGPNGSGKTTTMRLVMGLLARDAGTVEWRGEPITDEVRRSFGYMPAERGTYPKMRVGEQLEYFARLAGRSASTARASAHEWLERVGLADRADDEVQTLSSGNQQRVQLAIALVHAPDLLILDEPFSGLDPIAVEMMKELLLEQVERGVTVLLSSHQLDLVSDVCRDVVIVDRGRVVLEGPVHQLRSSSPLRDVVATVAGGDVEGFVAPDPSWNVVAADGATLRMRVPSSADPTAVFETIRTIGPIVEFSFTAPELSEVFIASIAGGATPSEHAMPVDGPIDGPVDGPVEERVQ
ncbi:MAG TPA: ATP-binding cassette domain-containing protein [Ilumatobacteraceae bacterium]|nr:ATP-binding cassette domain-containing protein [Ilumatobacteraceae bacterium]